MQTTHFQTTPHSPRFLTINADVLEKLGLMQRTVESLTREGHMVISIDHSSAKPTIQVQASNQLAQLAGNGQGAYYMRGIGADGLPYRKGTLLAYRNINVVWFERGH